MYGRGPHRRKFASGQIDTVAVTVRGRGKGASARPGDSRRLGVMGLTRIVRRQTPSRSRRVPGPNWHAAEPYRHLHQAPSRIGRH